MSDLDRQANVLGALSLMVEDRTTDAVIDTLGGSSSTTAAAALSALDQFLDMPTIDMLRQVLGLTPSGTVRLVDRLADSGYVTRSRGDDGRSRTVALTDSGREVAHRIADVRLKVLRSALERLTADERATYEALSERILGTLVRGPGATRWGCRLCDVHACERDAGHCPVMKEVFRRPSP